MNKLIKKIIIATWIVLIVLLYSPYIASAMGIGIGPSRLEITDALRGTEYTKTISISNPSEIDNIYILTSEGKAGEWMSFYELEDCEDFSTPIEQISVSGKENYYIIVKIDIPPDIASGIYNATICVQTLPPDEKKMGVGTVIKATSKITIGVTGEEIIDGVVNSIYLEKVETGYPLEISTVFKNTGNVEVKPKIDVVIFQDDIIIHSFSHQNASVKPSKTDIITAIWNTTKANMPGDYEANVTVLLDERVLKSDNLPFEIFPFGTLSRNGNLTDILIEGDFIIDSPLIIKAVFQNSGQIETSAKFTGDIYKDSKLIDNIISDELIAEKNKEVILKSYFKPTTSGNYLIKGNVIYSGKETPIKEVTFIVPDKGSIPGYGIFYGISVLLILVFALRKKLKYS